MHAGLLVIAILLARFIAPALAKSMPNSAFASWAHSAPARFSIRRLLWGLALTGCAVGIPIGFLVASLSQVAARLLLPVWFIVPMVLLLATWPILRALARNGRPHLVYYLAHAFLLFAPSRQTDEGAVLLAGLALAHRGGASAKERAWLRSRLERQRNASGVCGCAHALLRMLDARALHDEGRGVEANEARAQARAMLATVLYTSPNGTPRAVRALACELLALMHASCGEWEFVRGLPMRGLAPVARAVVAYAQARWNAADDGKPQLPRLDSPVIETLFARSHAPAPVSFDQALANAQATYLALTRGEPVGTHAQLMMLHAFDALLSPDFEQTAIPAEVRSDDAMVAQLQHELASALVPLLAIAPPPLGTLTTFGPISARVFQGLESHLQEELQRIGARLVEASNQHVRRDVESEWLDVSLARAAFQRLEMALGTAAAAVHWPDYSHAYCLFGVHLAETKPHRRPLAHAVFSCLHHDARRFGDDENVDQQYHNMRATSGAQ